MKLGKTLLVAAFSTTAISVFAASGSWTVDADGLWSVTTNWTGGTVADASGSTATFANDITGDRTVTLDSARTLSTITFGDADTASAGSWLIDGASLTLAGTTPTVTVNALGTGENATIAAVVAGTAGLTKSGAGTLVLTASNTYTGTTNIGAGTLALSGGDNRLATAGTVNFSGSSTLDIGATNQTLANLTVANGVTGTVVGTGTLTVSPATFSLGATTAATRVLNLSGLSAFVYDNSTGTFSVGANPSGTTTSASTTLTLAASNTITASIINIANGTSGVTTSANNTFIFLGQNNVFNADTINVGTNSRTNSTVQFQASLTNPTLTIRGVDGTSRANMTVCNQNSAAVANTGLVDLTTGVAGSSLLDALIGTLDVGYASRGAGAGGNVVRATGTFIMGGGTLDATAINIGRIAAGLSASGASSFGNGTFTLGGGSSAAGTVKVLTLTLGDQNANTTGLSISSVFNLNNGGILRAQNVQPGATVTGTVTRTFNWNDGTIKNYDASTDLTIASGLTTFALAATGTHTFDIDAGRAGTVNQTISGAGALTKTGAGTLVLTASNTYTGATNIDTGTLSLSGGDNRLAAAGTVNFSGTGTLDLGSTNQTLDTITVADNGYGTVTGTGNLTLTGAVFALDGTVAGTTRTLDFSNLGSFTYDNVAGTVTIGAATPVAGISRKLILADTNTITADTLTIGANSGGSANPPANFTDSVELGQNTVINASTINIGQNHSDATLSFRAGLADSPTLTIRGTDGVGRATDVIVGQSASNPGTNSVFDLVTGVTGTSALDALIGTLTVGIHNRNTTQTTNHVTAGSFVMGGGVLDATSIVLAQVNSGDNQGSVTGTFTSGSGTVKVDTLILGNGLSTATPSTSLTAIFNLNGGGVIQARSIAPGSGLGGGAKTRTFNWNDGTIKNYDASTDLTIDAFGAGGTFVLAGTGTHAFDIDAGRTGTVSQTISGTGALTKTGSGTLVLAAANAHSGGITLNAGTLAISGAGTLGPTTGALVLNGGTLALGATVQTVGDLTLGGAATVSGGTLNFGGAVKLTSASALLTNDGTAVLHFTGTTLDLGGVFDSGYNGSNYTLISGASDAAFTTITGSTAWNVAFSNDGNVGTLSFTAVPEPGTYGLLGAGALAGCAFVRRRRKRRPDGVRSSL